MEERTGAGSARSRRRIRVMIRRVDPRSVLKVSLVFYFCLMLIMLVGLGILYGVLDAIGILDSLEDLLTGLGFGGQEGFQFSVLGIFRTLFLIGVISVALWSAFTVFVAFLYNLIADLVGGIELTLAEKR
jgi:hypothetical protein